MDSVIKYSDLERGALVLQGLGGLQQGYLEPGSR